MVSKPLGLSRQRLCAKVRVSTLNLVVENGFNSNHPLTVVRIITETVGGVRSLHPISV